METNIGYPSTDHAITLKKIYKPPLNPSHADGLVFLKIRNPNKIKSKTRKLKKMTRSTHNMVLNAIKIIQKKNAIS